MCTLLLLVSIAAHQAQPSEVLAMPAVSELKASLDAAARHPQHVWRDMPPFDANGRVNAYIEIGRGDRRKQEFDMRANRLRLDRVLSESIGGYPVNYGFVPGTVSYDGDPFDVLVLGPRLAPGSVVQGVIVGLMQMEDGGVVDTKVVVAPSDGAGRPRHRLTSGERERIARFFEIYKRDDPGEVTRVPGWGSVEEARAFIETTRAFFERCRAATTACVIAAR